MDDKFKEVRYSEFEPDVNAQKLITEYAEGKPWLLLTAGITEGGDLSLGIEAGGGLPLESVEALLAKSLTAFRQGKGKS